MTKEEKAKAYDEALERARRIKNGEGDWRYSDLIEIGPALTEIFPQLCESEDEKIRKWLIDYYSRMKWHFDSSPNTKWLYEDEMPCKDILAWLEKQKEQPTNEEMLRTLRTEYEKGVADTIAKYEQKEQTPVDYDHEMWKNCEANFEGGKKEVIDHPEEYGLTKQKELPTNEEMPRTLRLEYEKGVADTVAKYEQKEQKPVECTELTWKDIVELEGIINNVHYDFSAGIGQESFGKEVLERFRNKKDDAEVDACEQNLSDIAPNQFNGITYGMQGHSTEKPEWSEEDEAFLKVAIAICNRYSHKDIADWLKSLRPPQYCEDCKLKKSVQGWKPSEEQMEAFRSYIKDFQEKAEAAVGGWNNFDVMIRLYEQLKKL